MLDEVWEVLGIGSVRKGFRACDGCGLVLQDPCVPPATMNAFYSAFSNYTNPMSGGDPSPMKVRAVDQQLAFLGGRVERGQQVFQVGSSDGYTLSRFRQAGCTVRGCDPSANAAAVARRLWDVETCVMPFEDYVFSADERYEWIVLTHVLEHLYDPVETLRKCGAALTEATGRVFVEVPLLAPAELLPPAYFQFEHVNYFSEASLTATLAAAGFEIEGEIEVDLESDLYPVQRLVARRSENAAASIVRRKDTAELCQEARRILHDFSRQEEATWSAFEASVLEKTGDALGDAGKFVIWGAGIHTSILLARTRLGQMRGLRGFIDSDSQKWGQSLVGLPVTGPESWVDELIEQGVSVVISTRPGEPAIRRYLLERGLREEQIVRLYGDDLQR